MELSTSTISNEIDKSIKEEISVSQAAIDEIKRRREKGQKPESISNEEIKKNDPILETYKVLDNAIHGGMGSVWRVHHESWNVDLAMKRPQPRFFAEGSEARKEEFIWECENWINLGLHPNIVSCYYVREIGGVPTIFSEWMDNGSLKDRIRDGSLYEGTEEEVQERILDIAIQTARGLQYSHENNLIHQDVKPGNILLTKDWDAKVADFGLAKAQSQLTENKKPVSTGYTIQYCPREQAEGAPAEKWMDVYAWALTVLEMYAGKRLWDTGTEAMDKIDEYLFQCKCKIPDVTKALIKSCLAEKLNNFSEIRSEMISIYYVIFGHVYTSSIPEINMLAAESLNNKAISMIDLGKHELANKILTQALSIQPDHVVSVFNQTMYQWAAGELSSEAAVLRIRSAAESSESLTKAFCEELKNIHSPMEFYNDPASERNDVRTQRRHEIRDADFDVYGSVWLACGNRSLYRIDCHTGETTLHQCFSDLEITNVACEASGRFIYFAERNIDCYERFNIFRLDTKNNYKKTSVTEIKGHYIKAFWVDDDKNQLICTLDSYKWHPFTDEKIWDYSMISINLETFEQTPLTFTWEQYDEITNLTGQAGYAPEWRILQNDDTLTLNNPELSLRFELKNRRILSVCRDGKSFFMRSTEFVSDNRNKTYYGYICHFPRNMKIKYQLNQIKDIIAIAERQKKTDISKRRFRKAIDQKDYQAAVAVFEEFRDQEGNRDSLSAIEMEKELSEHCRKVSVHHLIEIESKNLISQTDPFKYWKDYRDVSRFLSRSIDKKHRDDFKMFDDQTWKTLLSFIKPFRKQKEQCFIVGIREDSSEFVIMTEPEDRKLKELKTEFSLYLFDPKENSFRNIGMTGGKHNLFSPNGNTWIYRLDMEDRSSRGYPILYQRDSDKGSHLGESNIYASMDYDYCFSPDSKFLACCTDYKYYEKEKLTFFKTDNGEESFSVELPKEFRSKPCFSADGLSILMHGHFFRISYNYAVPDNPDWDEEVEWFLRFWTRKNPSLPKDSSAMDDLMEQLYYYGYGWLKRERIIECIEQYKRNLEEKNKPKKKFRLFGS